jgi:hypothetical protein
MRESIAHRKWADDIHRWVYGGRMGRRPLLTAGARSHRQQDAYFADVVEMCAQRKLDSMLD